MQISEPGGGGVSATEAEPCRFPKLEECAHFHYERVQLPQLTLTLQTNMDQSLHSQHTNEEQDSSDWYMVQVTSAEECWLVQRNYENFKMLDAQLHQCIYDRKISQLPDLSTHPSYGEDIEKLLVEYLTRFAIIADNSVNCGPVLNWFQMDNKGHRLLVPSEESRSINTPAVAAAYSVRRYVSQARDELNLEVGDMISVIDMASPAESIWWRGKRGFQVGFFPQHCVHIIGDKVPRNMPLPPPVVGSLAITPVKPVLRKHGKLIAFFRSFILNRPSRRRLKQSGILKERVFGCDLGEHLLNSGHDIPTVLKCCSEFIEKHGIVDGIYRLSGVTSNIQKLRNAFDEDRVPDLYTEDILQDIHSVASLLKMYFRELPNPLCTYQLYQSFVQAVQGCNNIKRNSLSDHDRLLKMREAVQKLPPPHYRTLEYLMRHLSRVAHHGTSTGMTTRNVAIVWAPNLLRCAELEVGGVAALQGVGVQAVVTEFLICYADLIFCDRLPILNGGNEFNIFIESSLSPKRCRPKSLAISTPTKLITLEEARTKHSLNKVDDNGYIEVGGGPGSLPKKYHTVIDLPPGSRKRNMSKRSPLGWRSFFSKSRSSSRSQGSLTKNSRKASTPGNITAEKCDVELDMSNIKRKLRPVKSAESLTSGHSEPASTEDILGPLHCLNKPPGHNRSVSHDSYFDLLQSSQHNSEGSLYDLSEIQLNFDLEESEMRMFSEDESLVSSPRVQKDAVHKRVLTRARPEEFGSTSNSSNPSPKKQARVILSPDFNSRKRSRLEDQLSDIQYIDCNTPEAACVISTTTAMVHSQEDAPLLAELYQPKTKPFHTNFDLSNKRQSLNLEKCQKPNISKSLTESNLQGELAIPSNHSSLLASPQSPLYKRFENSSTNTTPDVGTPLEVEYHNLNHYSSSAHRKSAGEGNGQQSSSYETVVSPVTKKSSPTYENVLTTISITYKSPNKSAKQSSTIDSPVDDDYENILLNPEQALIPTSLASLPLQQASQPHLQRKDGSLNSLPSNITSLVPKEKQSPSTPEERRPKSLSALDRDCYYSSSPSHMIKKSNEETITAEKYNEEREDIAAAVMHSPVVSTYKLIDNADQLSLTDLSLSEVLHSSTENLDSSHSSVTFPDNMSSKNSLSPNVSPMLFCERTRNDGSGKTLSQEILNSLSPSVVMLLETKGAMTPNSSSSANSSLADIVKFTNDAYEGIEEEEEREANEQLDYFKLPQAGGLNEEEDLTTHMDCETHTSDTKNDVLDFTLSDTCAVDCRDDATNLDCDGDRSMSKDVQAIPLDPESPNRDLDVQSTNSFNLIDFGSTENSKGNNEKRKSPPQTQNIEDSELDIYQQVKYFRRSVHEINSLLDLPSEKSQPLADLMIATPVIDDNIKISAIPMKMDDAISNADTENFDSLEVDNVHIYENVEEPLPNKIVIEEKISLPQLHPELNKNEEISQQQLQKTKVKDLTSRFEMREVSLTDKPPLPSFKRNDSQKLSSRSKEKTSPLLTAQNDEVAVEKSVQKVVYDRDSLPPCLRARQLKNAVKTRSLDEDEFARECGVKQVCERRKSMDENYGSKLIPLPKILNQPKPIPIEGETAADLHMAHSTENLSVLPPPEQKLNRERIEKYKEERRKVLHEKYRSESFREDKDKVLLSRFKQQPKGGSGNNAKLSGDETLVRDDQRRYGRTFSGSDPGPYFELPLSEISKTIAISNCEIEDTIKMLPEPDKKNNGYDSLEYDAGDDISLEQVMMQPRGLNDEESFGDFRDSIRYKTALFESQINQKSKHQTPDNNCKLSTDATDTTKKVQQEFKSKINVRKIVQDSNNIENDFLRNRRKNEDFGKNCSEMQRRHTYESRDRERETESVESDMAMMVNNRRISLENKSLRKDTKSPSYCIKDMKAIFESKSQQ